MCSELREEIKHGASVAEQLVDHMYAMGGAASTAFTVSRVEPSGRLCEWRVAVKLVGSVSPPAAVESMHERGVEG